MVQRIGHISSLIVLFMAILFHWTLIFITDTLTLPMSLVLQRWVLVMSFYLAAIIIRFVTKE